LGNDSIDPSNILHVEHLDKETTQQQILKAISNTKLRKPTDIRIVRRADDASAFLEFSSVLAAEQVLQRFRHSMFSEKQNMSFLNLGVKKGNVGSQF